MPEASRRLSIERSNGVWRLLLDHPPLNILDLEGMAELSAALAEAAEDREAKLLLLKGRGKAFCAGVDVADHTAERSDEMLCAFHDVVERLLGLEMPVVAAVNGPALGGGCELVLAADVVLGKEGATLGQPEIRLALFPPAAVVLLPRLVGRQAALDLLLSGRTVEMDEARELGLVGQVFPGDGFEEGVEEYVGRMASLSRPVLRLTKRAVRATADLPPAEALRTAESIYRNELMELHDPHEGLAAFMEKRTPVWRDA